MPESSFDVLCRECGRRRAIQSRLRPAPCAAPGDTGGFVIDHVEVTFLGQCPACTARAIRGDVPAAG